MKLSELLKLKAVSILGDFQKTFGAEDRRTYSMKDVGDMMTKLIEGLGAEADRLEAKNEAQAERVRKALSVAIDSLGVDRTAADRRAALDKIAEIMK